MRTIVQTLTLILLTMVAACGQRESMPEYPYDPPRSGDAGVSKVQLKNAISGHIVEAEQDGGARLRIQVADVIAPIKGQPWSVEAKAALEALVAGKRAWIREYQSIQGPNGIEIKVARVHVDGKDISWELIGSGNAWVWEEKSNDPQLAKLQDWARTNRKGLWALPASEIEPPWEYIDRLIERGSQTGID